MTSIQKGQQWSLQDLFDKGVELMDQAQNSTEYVRLEEAREYRKQAAIWFELWRGRARG